MSGSAEKALVIVFGSVNLDLSVQAPHTPAAGETVLGGALLMSGGGKGANQAHAARRFGADVMLFGAVGDDSLAGPALALLQTAGVDLRGVRRSAVGTTGAALITLDAAGENRIVVAPGANDEACADDVPDAALARAGVLLLQLEVPPAQSMALARRARAQGCRVMFNAAPLMAGQPLDLSSVHVAIVNQLELDQLAAMQGVVAATPQARAALLARSCGCAVLLTLGAHGALLVGPDGQALTERGYPVAVQDTTGAGDTFAGVFAAASAAGADSAHALRLANAAAALSCTARGAQPAQPTRAEIEAFLISHTTTAPTPTDDGDPA